MSITSRPSLFLIIDLEATCNKEPELPIEDMETVEFGLCLVDLSRLQVVDSFSQRVRPTKMENLTPFCQDLLGINETTLVDCPSFIEAANLVGGWLSQYTSSPVQWGSWGKYDKRQLEVDCHRHNVCLDYLSEHTNLKNLYSKQSGYRKHMGFRSALKVSGLELEGQLHSGVDDAMNIARLITAGHIRLNVEDRT